MERTRSKLWYSPDVSALASTKVSSGDALKEKSFGQMRGLFHYKKLRRAISLRRMLLRCAIRLHEDHSSLQKLASRMGAFVPNIR